MRTRRSLLLDLSIALGCSVAGGAAFGQGTPSSPANTSPVLAGVDVLAAEGFTRLAGLRVGLITNQTGRDASGRRTVDVLWGAPRVRLAAIFSPEHGLGGNRQGKIDSGIDAATGLPVHSLYGATRRPTAEMLGGLDALVIDLQDVGVRFFTYATTMAYAVEAAAPLGIKVLVLDRPNPIGPAGARGPMLDPGLRSFTGYLATPVQHGMTLGELAMMYNAESRVGARLEVAPMRGYRRDLWFDETGLQWIDPSPNLRSLDDAILYPGVGLIEGTNVSVGRGGPAPFTMVGAPWIDAQLFANRLNVRGIGGVRFDPAHFTPADDRYQGEPCHGVRVVLTDRSALDAPGLGVELACMLLRLYPERFRVTGMHGSLGSSESLAAIAAGEDATAIVASWRPALQAFESVRARYLLYS